jgi:hypothetical protein
VAGVVGRRACAGAARAGQLLQGEPELCLKPSSGDGRSGFGHRAAGPALPVESRVCGDLKAASDAGGRGVLAAAGGRSGGAKLSHERHRPSISGLSAGTMPAHGGLYQ